METGLTGSVSIWGARGTTLQFTLPLGCLSVSPTVDPGMGCGAPLGCGDSASLSATNLLCMRRYQLQRVEGSSPHMESASMEFQLQHQSLR